MSCNPKHMTFLGTLAERRFREGFWNGVLPMRVCPRQNRMIGYDMDC